MTKYHITNVRKDRDGDITDVKTIYSEFTVKEVISKIESKNHAFWVKTGNDEIVVLVVNGENKKYIRTYKDGKATNNLDELESF